MRTLEYLNLDEFDEFNVYYVCWHCEGAIKFSDDGEWFKCFKHIVNGLVERKQAILTCCPECQDIAFKSSRIYFKESKNASKGKTKFS